jgi:hypothetical protein
MSGRSARPTRFSRSRILLACRATSCARTFTDHGHDPPHPRQRRRSVMPVRVQLSRKAGYRLPENVVNVTRPGICGNPFVIGKHGTRAECIAKHRIIMTSEDHAEITRLFEEIYPGERVMRYVAVGRVKHPYQWSPGSEKADWFLCSTRPKILSMCRGNDVGCWCKLTDDCHGDTLLVESNR